MTSSDQDRYAVLLIEDDRDQIQFISTILGQDASSVQELRAAEALEAGIEIALEWEPDCILLDLNLPDSDGLDTFRRMNAAVQEIPIIIFSGNTDEDIAVEAVRLGAQDYIIKGDAREPLLSRSIRYAIERKRITSELRHTQEELAERNSALQVAREQLQAERDMFVAGPTIVIQRLAQPPFGILYVSRNIVRLGYQPVALREDEEGGLALLHPEDRDSVVEKWERQIAEGTEVLEIDYRMLDQKQETVWVHETTRLQRAGDDVPVSHTAYIVDISGRKRAENRLQDTQRRFETILENIDEALYEIDINGRFTFLSPGISRIIGYSADELTGMPVADILLPDRRAEWAESLLSMLQGRLSDCEYPVHAKNGSEYILHFSGRRRMQADYLVGLSGVISDVTEKRGTEDALRDVRTETQQYLDIAGVMLLSLDLEGRISIINRKGCELLGYQEHELVGKDWFELCIPERDREQLRRYFHRIVDGEVDQPETHENVVLNREKEERLLRWHNALLHNSKGRLVGILSSGEDITERRRIEKEVRGSRELLDLALWGANLGAWEFSLDTGRMSLNRRAAEMLGYDETDLPVFEEFRKKTLPEEDQGRLEELLRDHLDGVTDFYQAETWMISAKGDWKWILERGKTVEYDSSGRPLRVSGTYLDLTERKYAEVALEDSERKFRLLAENSTDIIWTADAELNLTFVSPSSEFILGYTPDQVMKLGFEKLVHDFQREDVIALMEQRVREGKDGDISQRSLRTEAQLRKNDGSLLWVEIVATPVLDHSGKVVTVHGNTRDIHKRKLAQLALKESEEKFRLLVENQTDLVVKVDLDGRFHFVSPSYCELFKKTEDELLGETFFPLVHEDDRNATLEAMKGLFEPPYIAHIEQRALTRDGWRWLAWVDTAVMDENGEVSAIIGVGRDVTERKMAELALIESEKRLRSVISNLPVILFTYDTDGIFLLSEGKGLESLGLESSQVVGQSVFDIYGDNPSVLDAVRRSLEGDSFTEVSNVGEHYYETWYTPLKNDRGKLTQVIGVAVDITGRIRADHELRRYRDHLEELVEARTLELERANERLKRFRFALDSAADNIYIVDPETMKFVDLNESAVRALGYSREDLMNMGPADIQSSGQSEDYLQMYQDVRQGKTEVGMFETRHRRQNGSDFPVEVFVRSFEIVSGQLLVATARDITRRKQVEMALKDSESKYRNVLENANEAIIVLQDNLLKFFNYKVLELTGLAERELVNISILEFVHPEDHQSVKLQYEKRIAGQHLPDSYDVRMFDSNGTIKWMEVRDVLITWEGEPATLNFFNDVTARKNAEHYIRFQASLLSIVRNSVIAIDLTGRVTYWNRYAEILYGWPASEVEGRKLSEIPSFGEEFREQLLPVLHQRGQWEGEVDRRRRDSAPLAIYAVWNAIVHENKVTGYVGIGIDLSERKKLERELLQSQKLASLGILSEGIAHELRNPLGYASSAAQLLRRKQNPTPEELDKFSTAIHTGVDKANKIVENLLLIGKPKGQLMKKQVDIIDIIEEAVELLHEHDLGKGVTIQTAFHDKPLLINGNREMVVQLFYNLFTNAVHAMNGQGRIQVEGERSDEKNLVRVCDSGPGIPSEYIEHIFDPFFTTAKGEKGDKGVGLGLTLCYFIMEDHDGRIELDTDTDEGAAFLLSFPVDTSATQ
ncbi:PAS domain S-box protein [bacterium]|nr:PAS domain S-box protein [bacterium]